MSFPFPSPFPFALSPFPLYPFALLPFCPLPFPLLPFTLYPLPLAPFFSWSPHPFCIFSLDDSIIRHSAHSTPRKYNAFRDTQPFFCHSRHILASVTDTIFHLQPSNGVGVNEVLPLRNSSFLSPSSTDGHASTAHATEWFPAHSQCFHASTALSPECSAVFHSVPQLLPPSACMLSHFQHRASRAVQQQRWPHRCVFPPPSFPASFSLALYLSLLLRTCNALALIVTPLSSPSFPSVLSLLFSF